jgi:hypothetical protein
VEPPLRGVVEDQTGGDAYAPKARGFDRRAGLEPGGETSPLLMIKSKGMMKKILFTAVTLFCMEARYERNVNSAQNDVNVPLARLGY